MSPDDPRHGTHAGYRAHRADGETACDPCKHGAAKSEARRHLPGARRRTSPVGVARRIQALVALGWGYRDIQRVSGIDAEELRRFAIGSRSYVFTTTVVKVDVTYRRLCAALPPENTPVEKMNRTRARRLAAQNGWLLPTEWDDIDDPAEDPFAELDPGYLDPVVLDRIIAGDLDLLEDVRHIEGPAVRREVCRRWYQSGRTLRDLGLRTGWQPCRYFKASEEAMSA